MSFASEHFGTNGEKWTPSGPLPDFTKAGYAGDGSTFIPLFPVNVRDRGAIGDGVADDTAAFLLAIDRGLGTRIMIPKGRYKITKQLVVKQSSIHFIGEDKANTTLVFPLPLSSVGGDVGPWGAGVGLDPWDRGYSWGSGYLQFMGGNNGKQIAKVSSEASQGTTKLTLDTVAGITVGQKLSLQMMDNGGILGRALLDGKHATPSKLAGRKLIEFCFRVKSISGNTITMDRPFYMPILAAYLPTVWTDLPTVTDFGAQNLSFEFPNAQHPGHHREPGFNAVACEKVQHGLFRKLRIVNADSGLFLHNSTKYVTWQSIEYDCGDKRARMGYGKDDLGEPQTVKVIGHHGIVLSGLCDLNLIDDLNFQKERWIHDIGVENLSSMNVFSKINGIDTTCDHHRRAPHHNLFTDIDTGLGNLFWQDSGDESNGPPGGIGETFWNIRATKAMTMPSFALKWNDALAERTIPNLYLAQKAIGTTPIPIPIPTPTPTPTPVVDQVKAKEAITLLNGMILSLDKVKTFIKSLIV